jgi:G6PDH family F420-dependent oxidoreductase
LAEHRDGKLIGFGRTREQARRRESRLMTQIGYTLFSETNGPKALVRQAVAAEDAGFDFAVISDHFHPWLASHTDSPFAWSVLGAVAHATERMWLGTLVTCPFVRYHPAVIAQAAATVQLLSDGRFTLSLGTGERLNEHVVGRGWPSIDLRHEMLSESVDAIRALWRGGYTTYRGEHITVEDARIYSLPERPPDILMAAGGQFSASLAGEKADGLVATDPRADLVQEFRSSGGEGKRTHGQIACSWDRDEERAREFAMRFAFAQTGWKTQAELPNPRNFDSAVAKIHREDVLQAVPSGSDPEPYVAGIRRFIDAGFQEVCVVQAGTDHEGFMEFFMTDVRPRLDAPARQTA